MATIHLIMQKKGGVGKSFAAAMLAQYLKDAGKELLCIDTDPGQKTFAAYEALDVHSLQILKGGYIDPVAFDKLIRVMADHQSKVDDFVIDVGGSSSFSGFNGYLQENDIIETLSDMGFSIIFHTVVVGGQAFKDTMDGMNELIATHQSDAEFFIWKNEYFAPVVDKVSPGEHLEFENTDLFKKHQHRIMAVVNISKQKPLFESDVSIMTENHFTFGEVDLYEGELFDFLNKTRLRKFKKAMFEQLDVAFGVDGDD